MVSVCYLIPFCLFAVEYNYGGATQASYGSYGSYGSTDSSAAGYGQQQQQSYGQTQQSYGQSGYGSYDQSAQSYGGQTNGMWHLLILGKLQHNANIY